MSDNCTPVTRMHVSREETAAREQERHLMPRRIDSKWPCE